MMQNLFFKMTENLAHRYSSESTQQEHSYEYQHGRAKMFLKNLCVILLLTKVALVTEGLKEVPIVIFLLSEV